MKASVDDFIMGKGIHYLGEFNEFYFCLTYSPGQGLIILLSGPPGTGKTLTAEAGKFIEPNVRLQNGPK